MKQTSEKRQYDPLMIFEWIVEYKQLNDGNSPTLAELMRAFRISSTSVARYQLCRLQRAGLIYVIGTHQARGICVVGGQWRLAEAIQT